jgi:hypothetical protein
MPLALRCFALLTFSLVLFAGGSLRAAELTAQLRRPVALAQSEDGRWLYVANRDSGSISVVDLASRQVVCEHALGKRLADLAAIAGSDRLLAVDEAAHELLILESSGPELKVAQRLVVSPYPVSICLAPDGRQATIASLWSRRLT